MSKKKNVSHSSKEEGVLIVGKIISANGDFFKVLPDSVQDPAMAVLCQPCGKIRKNEYRLHEGDKVECELSVYDLRRGRVMRVINEKK